MAAISEGYHLLQITFNTAAGSARRSQLREARETLKYRSDPPHSVGISKLEVLFCPAGQA